MTTCVTISEKSTMMTAICTRILRIRKNYAKRRRLANQEMVRAGRLTSRRERARKGRMTSMMAIKRRLRGQLRRGDAEARRGLEVAAVECKEDVEQSLLCLHQCTFYLDDLLLNPTVVKDAKYRAWEVALDLFLEELKNMVHYSIKPRRKDIKLVDLLIRMLSQMRIAESMVEQVEVRWNLQDGLANLLEDANKKFRRMGL